MNQKKIIQDVKRVRETSQKRNFSQTFDLIINLKDLNLKNTEEQVESFANLHYKRGKEVKICALVGPELATNAKENCDFTIPQQEFDKYAKDKKLTKNLVKEYDFFVAQANIMPQVAASFGQFLGPKGKMPNPKAGCIVPANANLKPLYDKLQKTVKLMAKTSLVLQCTVGQELMKDEEVVDNIITVYNHLTHLLPKEEGNIESIFLKLTMGSSLRIDKDAKQKAPAKEEKKAKPKTKPKEEKTEKEKKSTKPVKKEETPKKEIKEKTEEVKKDK